MTTNGGASLPCKRARESRTTQVQILMPAHINGYGRLFGGKLMEWIDVVAGVVARRHAGKSVTTVAVDHLLFKRPAHVDDTIVLEGCITYTGRTSMEVRVNTFVEELCGERILVNQAYLVFVALDEHERPAPVPRLVPETPEEEREWQAGVWRREMRAKRRDQAH